MGQPPPPPPPAPGRAGLVAGRPRVVPGNSSSTVLASTCLAAVGRMAAHCPASQGAEEKLLRRVLTFAPPMARSSNGLSVASQSG